MNSSWSRTSPTSPRGHSVPSNQTEGKYWIVPLLLPIYAPSVFFELQRAVEVVLIPLAVYEQLGNRDDVVGALMSSIFLGCVLMNFPAGSLSSKFGARISMLLGGTLLVCGDGLVLLHWSISSLRLMCFCKGAGYALYGLSRQSVIGRLVPSHRRGRATMLIGGLGRFMNIIGPLLAGAVVSFSGVQRTYFVHLLLCAPIPILGFLFAPNTSREGSASTLEDEGGVPPTKTTCCETISAALHSTFLPYFDMIRMYWTRLLTGGVYGLCLNGVRQAKNVLVVFQAKNIATLLFEGAHIPHSTVDVILNNPNTTTSPIPPSLSTMLSPLIPSPTSPTSPTYSTYSTSPTPSLLSVLSPSAAAATLLTQEAAATHLISVATAVLFSIETLFFPLSGFIMDKFGRKKNGVSCIIGIGIGLSMWFLIPTTHTDPMSYYIPFLLGGIFIGACNGMTSGLFLVLGMDLTPAEYRGEWLATYRTFGNIGEMSFPFLAGLISNRISTDIACLVFACVAVFGGFYNFFMVKETLVKKEDEVQIVQQQGSAILPAEEEEEEEEEMETFTEKV